MKGWMLAVLGVIALALLVGSFGFGMRYQAGRDAQATLKITQATLKTTREDLTDYHQRLQAAAAQFATDSQALHTIAEDTAHARTHQVHFAATLRTRLDAWLARHSAAGACGLDARGLRLWNDANRGARAERSDHRAGAAAAGDRRGALDAVPAAAAGDRRQAARADAQSSGDHRDLPPVRPGQSGPDQGGHHARRAAGGQAPARPQQYIALNAGTAR